MRAVAGVDVDMFGIQAFGAVIGVPIPRHGSAAMPAGKIFNISGKFTGHKKEYEIQCPLVQSMKTVYYKMFLMT